MFGKYTTLIFIICISLLGTGLRMATWQRTLLPGTGNEADIGSAAGSLSAGDRDDRILLGFDPYYHLRRADLAARGLPIPRLDYYSAYPFGARSHWPRLYDRFLSFFLRVGRWVPGISAETAVGFAPVVLGVMAIWALAPLFRRNERSGLFIAAGLLAILPAHSRFGSYGFCDHHVLELLLTGVTWSVFASLDPQQSRRSAARDALAGTLLAVCQLSWRGALLVQGVVILSLLWLGFGQGSAADRQRWRRAGLRSLITATGVFIAGAWMTEGAAFFDISFYTLGIFQALPMLIAAILFGVCVAWTTGWKAIAVTMGIMAPTLLAGFAGTTFHSWIRGFHFLLGRDPWRETITESVSIFQTPGIPPFPYLAEVMSGLAYAAPVIVFLLLRRLRNSDRPSREIVVMTAFVITFLIMCRQQRYAHLAAVAFAAAMALTAPGCVIAVRRMTAFTRWMVAAALLLSLVPPLTLQWFTLRTGNNLITRINRPRYDALQWLRTHTPVSGDFYRPDIPPSYGVMNPWDWGHWITWIAQRAPVANNHGTEPGGHREGMMASCRMYSTVAAAEARMIMDEVHARYVVTESDWRKLAGFASVAGRSGLFSVSLLSDVVVMRLHAFDGSDAFIPREAAPPYAVTGLDRYRLVYESREREVLAQWSVLPVVKIFEYVAGARLRVPAAAMPPMMMTADVVTNTGRQFKFRRVYHDRPDSVVCPYATGGDASQVRVEGPVVLSWTDGSAEYDVSETAICDAGTVKCRRSSIP
ncbi:hypothetical protein JXA80_09200 [bacterium]|nr:hypothetical protein [candidate division CSSED10-310 bacterium]